MTEMQIVSFIVSEIYSWIKGIVIVFAIFSLCSHVLQEGSSKTEKLIDHYFLRKRELIEEFSDSEVFNNDSTVN